jgi:hypothetical protein
VEIFGQVGVLGRCFFELKEGRKGDENTRERNFLPLFLCTSRGRRKSVVPFKMTLFWAFFYEQWMKQRCFGQNASFHLKEKDGKNLCQSPNLSSICNLFNQA